MTTASCTDQQWAAERAALELARSTDHIALAARWATVPQDDQQLVAVALARLWPAALLEVLREVPDVPDDPRAYLHRFDSVVRTATPDEADAIRLASAAAYKDGPILAIVWDDVVSRGSEAAVVLRLAGLLHTVLASLGIDSYAYLAHFAATHVHPDHGATS